MTQTLDKQLHPTTKYLNNQLITCDRAGQTDPIATIDIINGEVVTSTFNRCDSDETYRKISRTLGAVSYYSLDLDAGISL